MARFPLRSSLLVLLLASVTTAAQVADSGKEAKPFYVRIDGFRFLRELTKVVPVKVEVEDKELASVRKIAPDDPDSYILVSGKKVGSTVVKVTDKDGKVHRFPIIVRREKLLPLDVPIPLKLLSGKPLERSETGDEKIVRLKPWKGDSAAVEVTGVKQGETTAKLVGKDEKPETVHLFVKKCDLFVTVGESITHQMKTKKPIQNILVVDEGIIDIRETSRKDPSSVRLIGVSPGAVQLEFKDIDGTVENYVVGVEPKAR
jgi:hypothetical protein